MLLIHNMKKTTTNKPFRINLFWRILLWFWLASVLVFTVHFFIIQINNEGIHYRNMPPHLHNKLILTKDKLKGALENNNRGYNYRNKRQRKNPWRNVYLIDTAGVDYLGKTVPKLLYTLNQQVVSGQRVMSVAEKRNVFFGGIPLFYQNKEYRVYMNQRFSVLTRNYIGSFFRKFAIKLLISVFIISFPFSFLLAWIVTRPIKKLQLATKDISEDVTNRKNLQVLVNRRDEFGELAQDFELMSQHIESQLQSKNQLLSNVSHELRSPLARLQIALAIAAKKMDKDSNGHEFERIKREADRMNLMLAGLLDFAKVEASNHTNQFELVDIKKLLTVLLKDVNFEAQQQNITVAAELADNLLVLGEQGALLSCLENILRNAIRYANKKINVYSYAEKEKNQMVITISDDGDGVATVDIDKIFDAFYRPNVDRSRHSGGVGLGLSIAKKAVAAHSGKIWAENLEPIGFSIHILLPVKYN